MTREIEIIFEGSGIQANAYYLKEDVVRQLYERDWTREKISAWCFVQENADVTVPVSFGLCGDDPYLKIKIIEDGIEKETKIQSIELEEDEVSPDWIVADVLTSTDYGIKCPDPGAEHVGVLLEFTSYHQGSYGVSLSVSDEFKPCDLKMIYQDIDRVGWLGDNTYLTGQITREVQHPNNLGSSLVLESDIIGVIYNGERYECGGDLSFRGGDMELNFFVRDKKGELIEQDVEEIFESE